MRPVLTASQMREVDRLTSDRYGIPSVILMQNAAYSLAWVVAEKFDNSLTDRRVIILCGPGNNGGDGAALARILFSMGADVHTFLFGKVSGTKGDARTNFDILKGGGKADAEGSATPFGEFREIDLDEGRSVVSSEIARGCDVIVDAVFGTGLSRPLDDRMSEMIREASLDARVFRVAVDIPTGVDSDSGEAISGPFTADVTVTFTAPKPGNVLAPAARYNGRLVIADIGSPAELVDAQNPDLFLADESDLRDWLGKTQFSADSYKNERGHSVIIAGSEKYPGAAALAGNAAMRSGAGLVTVITPQSAKTEVASRLLPEVMLRGAAETEDGAIDEAAFDEVGDLLNKARSVVIGCGLSQSESTKHFVRKVIDARTQPIVVDADALNLLAPLADKFANSVDAPVIMTPHEGEFLRLLGTSDKDALKDRVGCVRKFAVDHQVILVLKGERVLIASPDGRVVVNPTGNSGLGKAGNGDTLTGIVSGFLAQAAALKVGIFESVVAAVFASGLAGDIAAEKWGKRVMTASDVRECLAEVFSSLGGRS